MPTAEMDSYRSRIYSTYVSARHEALAPDTTEGLRPCIPYLRIPYLRRMCRVGLPASRDAVILDLARIFRAP
ncbi:MAG: hypothetical protein JJ714_10930 [Acidithiobacillus sp.]|nr:hypothetical protein [Acidithiobacillus sp.]